MRVYRKYGSKLAVVSRAPKAVGFERDLYSTTGAGGGDKYLVEKSIMRMVDNDAAQALGIFELAKKPPENDRLNNAWTNFLVSLLHRTPSRIASIRASLDAEAKKVFSEIVEKYPEYEGKSQEDIITDATIDGAYQYLMERLVLSSRVGAALGAMTWCVIDTSENAHEFLMGDLPLIQSNGLGHNKSFVLLPIGPHSLFVASPKSDFSDWLLSLRGRDMMKFINDAMVRQAEHFVIALHERQSRFVENRLGTSTELVRTPWGVPTWSFSGWS